MTEPLSEALAFVDQLVQDIKDQCDSPTLAEKHLLSMTAAYRTTQEALGKAQAALETKDVHLGRLDALATNGINVFSSDFRRIISEALAVRGGRP